MGLKEFANAVLVAVREKADGAFSPDNNCGSCVYLDDYYEEYQNGRMEINEVAESVYLRIMECRNDLKDFSVADFLQWDITKHHLFAKLINADMNKEILGMIPHRHFLDLAVVYYIKVSGVAKNEGVASILIHNNHMEMWGQNEESLYQMAQANMHMEGEALFLDMEKLLKGVVPKKFKGEDADVKMYVLTNRSRVFGAVEIMDRNTLRGIGEKLKDDFIVLPSTIHETIIIPSDKALEYSELAEMVRVVNVTQVDVSERLSNHVYRYDRNEGILKLVA